MYYTHPHLLQHMALRTVVWFTGKHHGATGATGLQHAAHASDSRSALGEAPLRERMACILTGTSQNAMKGTCNSGKHIR